MDDDALTYEQEVAVCRRWIILNAGHTRRIQRRESSYSYKHRVESECGDYISNEAFIEAARSLGYHTVPCGPASPNRYFNMSLPKWKQEGYNND